MSPAEEIAAAWSGLSSEAQALFILVTLIVFIVFGGDDKTRREGEP